MIKIYSFLITSLIIHSFLFSQPNWVQLNSGVSTRLNVILFVGPTIGFAAGTNSVMLKTTNAGFNWFSSSAGIGQGSIFDIDFPDINTGYVLLDSSFHLKLYKTTNQGQSWTRVLYNGSSGSLKDISFVNTGTGFAATYNVLKTTDSGLNWSGIPLVNQYYTTSICMLSGSAGYIAGARSEHPLDRTSIFFSSSGIVWDISYTSQSGSVIFKMGNFIDINNGAFVTSIPPGNIYRKKNGGGWTIENPGIESIDYVNASLVFSCGPSGLILKSVNGGDNWFNSASGVNIALHSVSFVDASTGFVCGDNGVILKTTNGGGVVGLQNISSEIPKIFSLSQNYPNPFNPGTKIKFQIPSSALVKLTAYDVLGKEIQTLVNQILSAGTYETDFDGSNFPSGVYYYKLEAGEFTQTKKMVLIK